MLRVTSNIGGFIYHELILPPFVCMYTCLMWFTYLYTLPLFYQFLLFSVPNNSHGTKGSEGENVVFIVTDRGVIGCICYCVYILLMFLRVGTFCVLCLLPLKICYLMPISSFRITGLVTQAVKYHRI